MYEIIDSSNGERITICDKPRYIRIKPSTGAYIETDEKHAEGVSIIGNVYSLNGKLKDLPECQINKIDNGMLLSEYINKLISTQNNILDIEAALCELDSKEA